MQNRSCLVRFAGAVVVAALLAGVAPSAAHAVPPLYLPWEAGKTFTVTQGHNKGSHTGLDAWAWDFGLPANESVRAAAPGTVSSTWDRCAPFVADLSCGNGYGNYVVIDHGDGTFTKYAHLSSVAVRRGQPVGQAAHLGGAGNSGWSTGTHLHFHVQNGPGHAQSIQAAFVEGPAPEGQPITSRNRPSSPSARIAAVTGCSAMFTKEGATAEWLNQLACDDARAVALGGNRIAAITACGAMYMKDGPPTAGWVRQTDCDDAKVIATTQERMAVINRCDALYTKDGPAEAPWIKQLDCGDARAVALGGNRIAAITGCGAMVVKDGAAGASWVAQTGCGDAKAIATTQDRMAVINDCNALYTKDGPADAPWIRQLDCADARAVALGGNRIAAITGCGAMVIKDGPATAGWVPETDCGDAKAIATTQDRMAVINMCDALYTKDGPADAAWMKQLDCGDARAVALHTGSASAVVEIDAAVAAATARAGVESAEELVGDLP